MLALLVVSFPFTDLDDDEVAAREEFRLGTDPARADSDDDGLTDGFERRRTTDPLVADSDADGLDDGFEVARGLDPARVDSDDDGLRDAVELEYQSDPFAADTDGDNIMDVDESPYQDCDGDGFAGILDPDDDNDGLRDGDEPVNHRCNADVDQDGVLDGAEGAVECIENPDCDGDGLRDGEERGSGFDPLRADTFETNLPDAVLQAFALAGQPPSGDADDDGIPDLWEGETGLIDWGGFAPANETRDLLVEFVRVIDPGSRRIEAVSLQPAYQAVEEMFEAESDFDFQWVETVIQVDHTVQPTLIPSAHEEYYRDMLARAAYSTNPYVTTVFMNPQHDQGDVLHLGVAPIRGMIAAVDYGAHTDLRFGNGNIQVRLSPIWESAIDGGRSDLILNSGFIDYGRTGQDMFLQATNYRLTWRPYWFSTAPTIYFPASNQTVQLAHQGADVNMPRLAATIAHELGHTLGLCHVELPACAAALQPEEVAVGTTSTMHSGAPRGTLHFFETQWAQVREYATCPPHAPIKLVAQNASGADIIQAKYGIALEDILAVNTRACGLLPSIQSDLAPHDMGPPRPVQVQAEALPQYDPSVRWTAVYGAAAVAALMAGVFVAWWFRRPA